MNDTTLYEKKLNQLNEEYSMDMVTLERNMQWMEAHAKETNLLIKLYRQGKLNKILKDYI